MYPPQKQPQKSNRNLMGGLVVMAVTIVMSLILVYLLFHIFLTTPQNRTPLQFDLNLSITRIGILLVGFTILYISVDFIGFRIAKVYQWRIIYWMAKRLYETKRKPKKRRGKAAASFAHRLNPQTSKVTIPEIATLPFGSLKFEAGEKFLGPLFFPSWEIYTFWSFGWSSLFYGFVLALITTIPIGLWPTIVWFTPILLIIWLPLVIFHYWGLEWRRMTRFFFVTSKRYGKGEGQWSTLRFIFRKGFDATVQDTNIGNITKVSTDPVPREFGVYVNRLLELYLEGLADSDQRVGSVFIQGVAGVGNKLLLHYQFAPWINVLLQQAPILANQSQNTIMRIENIASQHELGKPGQKNDYRQLEMEAQAWRGQQQLRFEITQPEIVDLWGLYLQYLEQLAYPNTVSTTPPTSPTQSTPSAFPGVAEDELDSNTNSTPPTLYEDPVF